MTTLTLQPSAATGLDTMISAVAAQQGYNYGVVTSARVGGVASNTQRRMLLAFDISSLPAGQVISAATLTLNCSAEDVATDRSVGAHRALLQWYEGAKNGAAPDGGTDGSTWDYRNNNGSVAWGAEGGASGTDYAAVATATTAITGTGSFNWDVLADVQAWYAGTATNYGWFIVNTDETTADSGKTFDTSDNATAGNRPILVIEYAPIPPVELFALEVDWDKDGTYTDETEYGKQIQIRRGRKNTIVGDSYDTVQVGQLEVVLRNSTRRFDPAYSSSPIYAYLLPYRNVRLRVNDGTRTYTLFTGYLKDLRPVHKDKIARLEAVDGIDYLTAQKGNNTDDVQLDYAVSQAITDLANEAGYPYADTSGWTFPAELGVDSYLGSTLVESNGDEIPYWWGNPDQSVWRNMMEIAEAFAGNVYVAADGTLAYDARQYGGVVAASVVDAQVFKDAELQQPWEEIRNSIRITAHPMTTTAANSELWKLYEIPYIEPGASITLWAEYMYSNVRAAALSVTTPAATTDYLANAQEDDLGTVKTAQLGVVMTAYAGEAKLVLTNNDAAGIYVTLFKLRGTGVYSPNETVRQAEDATSMDPNTGYGKRSLPIGNQWIQDMADAQDHAGFDLARFKDPRKILWLKLVNQFDLQFGIDLFQLVNLDLDTLGVDGDYVVTYIEHNIRSKVDYETIWRLEPSPTTGYWTFTTALGETSILGW